LAHLAGPANPCLLLSLSLLDSARDSIYCVYVLKTHSVL
jgi:hypothetical protein